MERMRFSDLNGSVETSFAGNKRGCFLSIASAFVLTLLAIAIAVGVGILVHFAGSSRTVQCQCSYPADNGPTLEAGHVSPTSNPDLIWNHCYNLSVARNECLSTPPCAGAHPPSTATPTVKTTIKDVRLPHHLHPIHYNLELGPDIYGPEPEKFTFNGSIEIYMLCRNATNVIILHINQLTIYNDSIELQDRDRSSSAPSWTYWEEDTARQFFKLHLEDSLIPGHTYMLRLNFTGPLKDDLVGLYRSSYKEGNETRWMATTQFQPTDARKAFPCFDEPALKATFNITLLRRAPMRALSNMPILHTEQRSDGWLADRFNQTVEMSTYLLAMIVCDYEYREAFTSNGVRFRVWATRSAIEQVHYALDIGVRILEYFETYFSLPFPLPKQDMIAIPDFAAGAMENWGLITYRETALLYDPDVSSTSNKQRVAVVVSHELAHQWFGNLVTPSWWDDLWLNEGFASYVEYIGVNHVHPAWKMMEQFVTEDLQDVLMTDGLGTSHPIYVPVYHPDEINEIFDKISYAKGASVIRMMNDFLGESTFRNGLSKYLAHHKYGNAHHIDLWKSLEEQAIQDGHTDLDIQAVMDTWVLQMGYPVVTMTRDYRRGDTADVTQDHFLLDPQQKPDRKYITPFDYKWMVPLTYTTSANPQWDMPVRAWMKMGDLSVTGIPANATWIIGNVQQSGFYRVNYDLRNWDALVTQLNQNHEIFPIKNRAQIIDDSFNIGRSGMISQLLGLQAIEYLSKELEYLPWEAATVNLGYIDDMLEKSSSYGMLQNYLLELVTPTYNRLGWNEDPNMPHLEKYLQIIAVGYACKYGNKHCLDTASRLYKQWMDDASSNIVNPDLRTLVYCHAIRNGGQVEWDFAYSKYKVVTVASEKDKLLYALSCTREPWLLSRYLREMLDGEQIRKQDAVYTVVYIARNPVGRYLAWDFIRAKWDYIRGAFGGGFFATSRLISGVTSSFNTEFELKQLREFVKAEASKLGSGERAFEQAIEKTLVNIKWMNANEKVITDWLTQRFAQR